MLPAGAEGVDDSGGIDERRAGGIGGCDNVVFTEYLAPENPVGTWVTYHEVNAEVNEDAWLNEIVDALKPYT